MLGGEVGALELPSVPLDDALDICLALLELEPDSYPRIATRWGSRLAIERKLDLVDAQLAFAALAALPGPSARAGVEALIEISTRYGMRRGDELLSAWLDRRGRTYRLAPGVGRQPCSSIRNASNWRRSRSGWNGSFPSRSSPATRSISYRRESLPGGSSHSPES
jgi:hypothetical protein